MEIQKAIDKAAARLQQENALLIMEVLLWSHDVDRDEQTHGSEIVDMQFIVPLHGTKEIVCNVPQTPQVKKHLKIKGGLLLNGGLCFRLFSPTVAANSITFGAREDVITKGFGLPSSDDNSTLKIANNDGSAGWTMAVEFSKTGVLTKFSFKHNSTEHPNMTRYFEEIALHRYAERVRQVYGK